MRTRTDLVPLIYTFLVNTMLCCRCCAAEEPGWTDAYETTERESDLEPWLCKVSNEQFSKHAGFHTASYHRTLYHIHNCKEIYRMQLPLDSFKNRIAT